MSRRNVSRPVLSSVVLLALAFVGCTMSPATGEKPGVAATKGAGSVADSRPTVRIDVGVDAPVTDPSGVTWEADRGFDGGTTVDRPTLEITGTNSPALYRTERYSMNAYSFQVPNGNYTLKLHFSEDYEGITDPSMRIFTYAVKDGGPGGKTVKEVKDFSPWKSAGGPAKAYIDSVPVTVTGGQISITFTPQVENPQINAIEIIPR